MGRNNLKKICWLALFCIMLSSLKAQTVEDKKSLFAVLEKAAELVKDGSPRAAINTCFREYIDTPAFEQSSEVVQERFLFEYIDTCLRAADKLPPEVAQKYLEEAVQLARIYHNWYGNASAEFKERLKRLGINHQRVTSVTFTLGVAHKRMASQHPQKRRELIDAYEQIQLTKAHYFSERSLDLWEESLRMYPDFVREESDDRKIRERVKNDSEYKDRWTAFGQLMQAFKSVPRMRRLARRKLLMISFLLDQ